MDASNAITFIPSAATCIRSLDRIRPKSESAGNRLAASPSDFGSRWIRFQPLGRVSAYDWSGTTSRPVSPMTVSDGSGDGVGVGAMVGVGDGLGVGVGVAAAAAGEIVAAGVPLADRRSATERERPDDHRQEQDPAIRPGGRASRFQS